MVDPILLGWNRGGSAAPGAAMALPLALLPVGAASLCLLAVRFYGGGVRGCPASAPSTGR
eukprot:2780183-Pyramimonas_sp.AAC.1